MSEEMKDRECTEAEMETKPEPVQTALPKTAARSRRKRETGEPERTRQPRTLPSRRKRDFSQRRRISGISRLKS